MGNNKAVEVGKDPTTACFILEEIAIALPKIKNKISYIFTPLMLNRRFSVIKQFYNYDSVCKIIYTLIYTHTKLGRKSMKPVMMILSIFFLSRKKSHPG